MEGRWLPPGLHGFDALRPGDRIATPRRAVPAALVDAFAALTGDRFAIHMSDAAARDAGFGGRVAHGLLVLALIDGLKNRAAARFDAVASLGWRWSFIAPVLAGQEIGAVLTVAGKRATRRPDRGILRLAVTATDGQGAVLQRGWNLLMVRRP
ncbi:MAG: MaoC family dehydratase [Rhodobacteraceae bacterium]|nr:MaoC family dehydratase [Paracoccaceae bacterium]